MRYRNRLTALCITLALTIGISAAPGNEQTACRSVHWGYQAPSATAFYNELTIDRSAVGTYFAVCGWDSGYFGLQELGDGKKVVIFSVWEPSQTDRQQDVPEAERVQLVHQGEGVRIGRFGGEGTGGKSFLDYDWKLDQTYRFLVTSKIDGNRTEYAGYFYLPDESKWKHLVTFSTPNGGKQLGGYYSFVEDFRRNGESAKQVRQAHFGNGWVRNAAGEWRPIVKAQFTADNNPAVNIDARLEADRFFLTTGGNTENRHLKLNDFDERKVTADTAAPDDLP